MKDSKHDYKESMQETLLELKIKTSHLMKKFQKHQKKNKFK
jgi:hypothetical protein